MATSRADHPDQPVSNLRQERLACGIADSSLDQVVAEATRERAREGDCYSVPGCAKLLKRVTQELETMAAPVIASEQPPAPFRRRLEALLGSFPQPADDLIGCDFIREMTRTGSEKHDSVHQLVMDLHKRLNVMQTDLAEERLDGAAVYGIRKSDRPLISAFMEGLNRTAPLKFDHPGLETTATRAGRALVIQNDIGTTGAHVIVIHVEGLTVGVTYTDVHRERADFFRDMLKSHEVGWSAERAGRLEGVSEDADFTMLTGTFQAENRAAVSAYLSFLGSRLVFLIDWNRARKELRGILRGDDRIAVLAWAAEAEVGQRGFLELGGARIVNQAIERVAGSAMHYGDRLCEALGDEAAVRLVKFVFTTATEGLREHQSPGLIEDRVCAELRAHFSSEGQRLLEVAAEHAGLIFELASRVRDGILSMNAGAPQSDYERLAARARTLEHDADQLVIAAREAVRKRPEYTPLFRVTATADDAADELEEVAFLLGLLNATSPSGDALEALGVLSALLVEASQEWIKALAHTAGMRDQRRQEDADDFLLAVDKLLALEHQADDAERALTNITVQTATDFRQLHLYSETGSSLEVAADAFKGAGLIARDHLFTRVLGT